MKMFICGCMVFLSASMLWAYDVDGGFLAALMTRPKTPAEPVKPVDNNGKILEHAQVEASAVAVSSHAEVLVGQQGGPESVMNNTKGKALEDANIPSSDAREALKEQETVEDLQEYPVVSGQGPNEDESVSKAALDLKLFNPNPDGAGAVRMAKPAVEKAG
jgi:hypothetical protein